MQPPSSRVESDSAQVPAGALPRHGLVDDIQGLCIAAIVAALGVSILASGGLMAGGITGVALLLHYLGGWGFGLLFVLLNLPFYVLARRRMGWEFALKTFLAVCVTGLVAELIPRVATLSMHPLFAAVFGGALAGVGILLFIRHRASLGGIGIVVVWLQQTRGWSAGKLQMGFDALVMLASLAVLSPVEVLYSLVGVAMVNLVLVFNHRPGRYMGT